MEDISKTASAPYESAASICDWSTMISFIRIGIDVDFLIETKCSRLPLKLSGSVEQILLLHQLFHTSLLSLLVLFCIQRVQMKGRHTSPLPQWPENLSLIVPPLDFFCFEKFHSAWNNIPSKPSALRNKPVFVKYHQAS